MALVAPLCTGLGVRPGLSSSSGVEGRVGLVGELVVVIEKRQRERRGIVFRQIAHGGADDGRRVRMNAAQVVVGEAAFAGKTERGRVGQTAGVPKGASPCGWLLRPGASSACGSDIQALPWPRVVGAKQLRSALLCGLISIADS